MVNDADGSEFPTHAFYDEVTCPGPAGLDGPRLGHAGDLRIRRAGRRPYRGAHPPDQRARGRSRRPRPRPASSRRSTVSRPTWPRWTRRARPSGRPGPRTLDGPDPSGAIAEEYLALAELLASSSVEVWDAPSLCEGWRTREVVAHVTMPARYSTAEFMAELEAAGGDFTAPVQHRGGPGRRAPRRPVARRPALSRSCTRGEPPGGGTTARIDALRHSRARHH